MTLVIPRPGAASVVVEVGKNSSSEASTPINLAPPETAPLSVPEYEDGVLPGAPGSGLVIDFQRTGSNEGADPVPPYPYPPWPPIPPVSFGGDMLRSVYDTNFDGIVDEAERVSWHGIYDIPASFPSTIPDVVGLQQALDEIASGQAQDGSVSRPYPSNVGSILRRGTPICLVNGLWRIATSLDGFHRVVGLNIQDTSPGALTRAQMFNVFEMPVLEWELVTDHVGPLAVGSKYFVDTTGRLTFTRPATDFVVEVGYAVAPTQMMIALKPPIRL